MDSDPPDSDPPDSDEPALPSVVLNELMASNEGVVRDEEGRSESDWLELYNAGEEAVDLGGYFLSDDWTDKTMAPLPEGTVIEPGAHLLLWADGDDIKGEGHLPFKLDQQGEGVGLFDPEEATVNWVNYPALSDNYVWARLPDGSKDWDEVVRGTPGYANARVCESEVTLVEAGATWSYLDTGEDPGEEWKSLDFDDSAWASGPAPLGYGDDQTTVVSYGDNSSDKHPTTWFRHVFSYEKQEGDLGSTTLWLRIDDGGLVHLNGEEVVRQGMAEGEIGADDYATYTAGDDAETAFTDYEIDGELLLHGDNVLAVEVHQVNATSSDISFDLYLVEVRWVEKGKD